MNYLNYYITALKTIGFNPIIIQHKVSNNKLFLDFMELYEHYSINPREFELQCFARYFAVSELHTSNDQFIISDSDMFVTSYARTLPEKLASKKNTFIGSEGFDEKGSEKQISPHFSVWDKELLNDFINHLISTYSKNKKDQCLKEEYIQRKKRFNRTGISDMTLLMSWILTNSIPFYNSNAINDLGIDHNISSLICHDGSFKSFLGRKKIIRNGNDIMTETTFKALEKMSVLHFQGRYKICLLDFYKNRQFSIIAKSFYIKTGRFVRSLID
jgi:hypothetical protein